MFRVALANLTFPATAEDSVNKTEKAIEQAADDGAAIICFPECYVPGYRGLNKRSLHLIQLFSIVPGRGSPRLQEAQTSL
jgi:predicted amidohydrolase